MRVNGLVAWSAQREAVAGASANSFPVCWSATNAARLTWLLVRPDPVTWPS